MIASRQSQAFPIVRIDQIQAEKRYALNGGPFGSKLVTRDYVDLGVPVIRGVNLPLDRRFSVDSLVFVSENKADQLRPNNAHPGDLVFTQRGTLGQVGIIPHDSRFPRFVISQSQMKLTVNEAKADKLYVYYYFRCPETVQMIHDRAISAGVPHINLETLRAFPLPLPPFATQRRVAVILSAYDELIENNRRRIAILEEMARSLYREWFVHFRFPGHEKVRMVESAIGRIPEGWAPAKFTDVAYVLSGGTPKTAEPRYWGGCVPFFTPRDASASPGFFMLTTLKYLSEDGLKSCNSQLYPRETIFITARGTVGSVVLAGSDMAMNQSCYALRGRGGIPQLYLYLLALAQVDFLKKNTGGATFGTIVVETFERLMVVKPAVQVIEKFEACVRPIFDLVRNLLEGNRILRATRDLLLPKLVSGEIEVSDVKAATLREAAR